MFQYCSNEVCILKRLYWVQISTVNVRIFTFILRKQAKTKEDMERRFLREETPARTCAFLPEFNWMWVKHWDWSAELSFLLSLLFDPAHPIRPLRRASLGTVRNVRFRLFEALMIFLQTRGKQGCVLLTIQLTLCRITQLSYKARNDRAHAFNIGSEFPSNHPARAPGSPFHIIRGTYICRQTGRPFFPRHEPLYRTPVNLLREYISDLVN